jgi:O-antigen ligase
MNLRRLLFLLSVLVLWLTQARGALLGFLISFPVLLYWKNKKLFLKGVFAALLLLGAIVAISSVSNIQSSDSLRVFQSLKSENSRLRLSQYKLGWSAFLEKPLLGQGWRSLEERSAEIKNRHNLEFPEFAGHAHNNLLEVLGAAGILGFLALCAWIAFWIRDLYIARNQSRLVSLYLAFLVAFLVSGLVQSTIIDSEFMFTFLALYGLLPLILNCKELARDR